GARCAAAAAVSARARQPEHALGEDVALDLRRPREQRRRTIVEVRASEPAAGDGVRPRLPAQSARPEELHHGLVHALAHLAPEELDEARLRAEREGLLEPRQG